MYIIYDYIYYSFVKNQKNRVDNLYFFAFVNVSGIQMFNFTTIIEFINNKTSVIELFFLVTGNILILIYNWMRYKKINNKILMLFKKWDNDSRFVFLFKQTLVYMYDFISIILFITSIN